MVSPIRLYRHALDLSMFGDTEVARGVLGMANTTTLAPKDQVTVPRDIRKRDLKLGGKITFSLLSDGTLVGKPRNRRIADLAGTLHKHSEAMLPVFEMKVDLSDDGC